MSTHLEKCKRFHELHHAGEAFLMPNPWDEGSAKVLAAKGAKAIATTSAGHAFTIGKCDGDGSVTRSEAILHAKVLVEAVDIPVSADLENGYGAAPEEVAQTVRDAIASGLAGCSIEDSTMLEDNLSYDFDLSVQRVAEAAKVVKQSGLPFMFCARADGVMLRSYDLAEAIRRIKAFEEAGADMVYVPLVTDVEAIKELVAAVSIPINVLVIGKLTKLKQEDFTELGVARLSLGSGLARLAHQTLLDATDAMVGNGEFSLLRNAADGSVVDSLLK